MCVHHMILPITPCYMPLGSPSNGTFKGNTCEIADHKLFRLVTFKFRHELFKDEATTIRKHLHQCMGVFSARHFPPNAEH